MSRKWLTLAPSVAALTLALSLAGVGVAAAADNSGSTAAAGTSTASVENTGAAPQVVSPDTWWTPA
jgi:hypothetical protein